MAKLSVRAKERTENTAAMLGDVLYAKCEAPVPEQDWVVLVQAIAAGDQLALHALYERSHRVVFTLIMRITANRETAEESPSTSSTTSGGAPRATTPRTARCSAGS